MKRDYIMAKDALENKSEAIRTLVRQASLIIDDIEYIENNTGMQFTIAINNINQAIESLLKCKDAINYNIESIENTINTFCD